jgi:ssDNA-binding Zn-finger/Zn-ribbon topoisomerase 1
MEDKKCPICDSDMIVIKGPYGDFWGCSSYPKCTHSESKRNRLIETPDPLYCAWDDDMEWFDVKDVFSELIR